MSVLRLKLRLLRRRRQRGAAAVEFAITIALLMLITMGLIDYGYFWYVHHVVTNAAREEARIAVKGASCGGGGGSGSTCPIASAYLASSGLPASITCGITTVAAPPARCEVDLIYPVGSITGFLPAGFVPANARAIVKMRQQ
jgi:Flp pilus assembly protein TadG